jgi:hypothetical protein
MKSFVKPVKTCLERTDTTKRQNDKTTKRQNDKTTKRQNDKTTKLYTHHHNSDTFREALNLPCSLCFRIWIYIHRRLYGRFERLAQSNWSEFDRLTPITYELPKRLKLQKKYTEYCLVFFISDFEQVCLILEPWNGKVFVALRLSVSPRAKRLLEAQLQLYTHTPPQQAQMTIQRYNSLLIRIRIVSSVTSFVNVADLCMSSARQG